MDRDEVISLFKEKPRHAGRLLVGIAEIESSPGSTISEKAYNYCYSGSAEKFSGCLSCRKPFKNFISFNQGYRHFCSPKCAASAEDTKQNKKQGMLKKYGVENPMQAEKIRLKAQATNLKRHGSITPLQRADVQAKVKANLIEKYGVDHAFKIPSVKQVARQRKLTNYAAELWPGRLAAIEHNCQVKLSEFTRDFQGEGFEYTWIHDCGTSFKSRVSSGSILSCPHCKVKYRSHGEDQLAQFVQEFTTTILNCRDVVRPYELDVYCPELRVAFEYNGTYWHTDEYKSKTYHLDKLLACQAQGIKLIQIFENDWQEKQEIVKSRILAQLGKAKRIYARSCQVQEVSSREAMKFLRETHLQGAIGSTVKLGLYHAEVLVALMTFGSPRYHSTANHELLRYSTQRGITVVGGASKLFKAFMKQASGQVITYADRCWSDGGLYRALGFQELSPSPPSFQHVKGGVILSRFQAQKHKLKSLLGDKYQADLSAHDNMKLSGYHRLYDCGNLVFQYTIKE